ncbi:MAG: hypothetical protein QXD23_03470, partial [Candidatus Micrarchaeaceae archaeon]
MVKNNSQSFSRTTKKNINKEQKQLGKKPMYSKRTRYIITSIIVILSFLLLYTFFTINYSIIIRIILALITLFISGILITRLNGLNGDHGLYLYSGTRGINTIERLSNWKQGFWIFLSEWGLVLSFGILSYFIFKNRITKKALII